MVKNKNCLVLDYSYLQNFGLEKEISKKAKNINADCAFIEGPFDAVGFF